MSTPRPQKGKCWSVQCIPSRGITVRCGGQDADCPYRIENHGPLMQELREPHYHELIEGVAAPLEPTRITTTQSQEEARIFKDDNIKLYEQLEIAEARIRELEKEIAKLKLTLELAELHIAELEKNRG